MSFPLESGSDSWPADLFELCHQFPVFGLQLPVGRSQVLKLEFVLVDLLLERFDCLLGPQQVMHGRIQKRQPQLSLLLQGLTDDAVL